MDKFYAKITKYGDSSYVLVPSNLMKFAGLELGDEVEVYIKKRE